jgi:tryptophan synthase alpha chain
MRRDCIVARAPSSAPTAAATTAIASDACRALSARVRAKHPDLAVIFFTAYNLVFHRGDEAFVNAAADAGADGILVPDLPHEEAGDLVRAAQARGLSTVFLVAPTTTPQRAAVAVDGLRA